MRETRAAAALGFAGGKPVSNRTLRKFRQRRRTHPGFPWKGKFETAEQVAAYFAGGTIECLECGRVLKSIGQHLVRIHGMSVEQYKIKFGLPWSRGLACDDSSDRYADVVRKRLESDEVFQQILIDGRKLCHEAPHRPRAEYIRREQRDRLLGVPGYTPYDSETAGEFLRRLSTGRTPQEVSADFDMPGMTWFYAYKRDNTEFEARYRAAVEALPFPVQAKMDSLGQRFNEAVVGLFKHGMSDHTIAKKLGVTAMTCNYITKPLRAAA